MRSLLGRFHRPNARSQSEQLFMLNNLGDGSTLSLDFTTGVLDPRLTFTRSTTGTYINSSGYVTSAAINAPRFDYDPTALTARGLLIEGSATSLSRSSADLTNAAYWTLQTAYTATSNSAGPSPDGTNNASSFTEPSTSLQRSIYQSYSSAAGTYTGSMWAKLSSGSTRYIRLVVSSGSSDFGYVTVNISTGGIQQAATAVGTATNASATVTAYPSGWYRITLSVTLASSINFMFVVPTNLSSIDTPTTNYGRVEYLGNGSVFLLWGAQVEAGSGASSYIPTGASTGSRAKDVCNITGSNFSSWFVDGPGTIVAQSDNVKFNTRNLLCEFNKDASNYIQMGVAAGAGSGEALFYNPDGFSQTGTTPSLNTAYKSAYVWDTNYFKTCLNGTLGSADTIGNIVSSGMVDLSIGGDLTNPTDSYIKNGHIRSLKYWPTRLPDAQLQALTT
jgi:hypothetical protein